MSEIMKDMTLLFYLPFSIQFKPLDRFFLPHFLLLSLTAFNISFTAKVLQFVGFFKII